MSEPGLGCTVEACPCLSLNLTMGVSPLASRHVCSAGGPLTGTLNQRKGEIKTPYGNACYVLFRGSGWVSSMGFLVCASGGVPRGGSVRQPDFLRGRQRRFGLRRAPGVIAVSGVRVERNLPSSARWPLPGDGTPLEQFSQGRQCRCLMMGSRHGWHTECLMAVTRCL